ncbi:MAG: VWA domain-containing protein [Armatimonadia bacterium]|nr:VWA domain-containing protein [Armatimonadia bacterium]
MNFARMFGIEAVDLEASATAGLSGGNIARDGVELAISQDASGSFIDELEDAKVADNALIDIVEDAVVEDDTSGVNKFRGEVQREIDLTAVGDQASQIHSAIDGIYHDTNMASGTHTALGIEDATDMLVNRSGGDSTSPVIVLVSDGMPFGYATWEWQYTWRYHYYYGWYKDWYQVQTMTEEEHTEYRRQRAIEAADAAADQDIKIHTVTFVQEPPSGYEYGQSGADADFNASLVRNGGYAFHTPEPEDLEIILECVGYIEVGRPMLIE